MADFVPVFLAFLFTQLGLMLYTQLPETELAGPKLAAFFFSSTILMLCRNLKLYPTGMRQLSKFPKFGVEFLIVKLLMEYSMIKIWYPLASRLTTMLPNFADSFEEVMQRTDISVFESFMEFLRAGATSSLFCLGVSLFMLTAVLHGTRAINLRLLQYGPSCFINDVIITIKGTFKKGWKKVWQKKDLRVRLVEGDPRLRSDSVYRGSRKPKRYCSRGRYNDNGQERPISRRSRERNAERESLESGSDASEGDPRLRSDSDYRGSRKPKRYCGRGRDNDNVGQKRPISRRSRKRNAERESLESGSDASESDPRLRSDSDYRCSRKPKR